MCCGHVMASVDCLCINLNILSNGFGCLDLSATEISLINGFALHLHIYKIISDAPKFRQPNIWKLNVERQNHWTETVTVTFQTAAFSDGAFRLCQCLFRAHRVKLQQVNMTAVWTLAGPTILISFDEQGSFSLCCSCVFKQRVNWSCLPL